MNTTPTYEHDQDGYIADVLNTTNQPFGLNIHALIATDNAHNVERFFYAMSPTWDEWDNPTPAELRDLADQTDNLKAWLLNAAQAIEQAQHTYQH